MNLWRNQENNPTQRLILAQRITQIPQDRGAAPNQIAPMSLVGAPV